MTPSCPNRIVHVPRRLVAEEWGCTETVILEIPRQQQRAGLEPVIMTSMALAKQRSESIGGVPVKRYPYCYPFFGLSADDKAAMDKKGGNLLSLERRQRELDAQLTDAESKMKDRRMRIARIRNDKELGLVRPEIDALKEVMGAAETELLGLMEQGDQRRTAVEAARQALAAAEAARAKEAEELDATIARVAGAIEEDRARRDSLLATIDADLHRRYELLFSRRSGMAVVRISGGACQGCHMNVPPQLFNQIQRNEQIFLCPSCQRILFWERQDDEVKA